MSERKEDICVTLKDKTLLASNPHYELAIEVDKIVNPRRLIDKLSGQLYADCDYSYQLEIKIGGKIYTSTKLLYEKHIVETTDEGTTIVLYGKPDFEEECSKIKIRHEFVIPEHQPYLEEKITIINNSGELCDVRVMKFGFRKALYDISKKQWIDQMYGFDTQATQPKGFHLIGVPFKISPTGQKREYTMWGLQSGHASHSLLLSEAWTWTNGKHGLLLSQYSQDPIRFSVFETTYNSNGIFLRYGGAGEESEKNEDGSIVKIEPNQQLSFGTARYTFIKGGWREGYKEYKQYMNSLGHGLPEEYDPPLHWEQYYDYPWQHYDLDQMLKEAKRGKEMGCNVLYLDPRWNKICGSGQWNEDKLGSFDEFVRIVREEYGLDGVALHIMGDIRADSPDALPKDLFPGCYRVDKEGVTHYDQICYQSRWKEEKAKRLLQLAEEEGLKFLMFDFHSWHGACWDTSHGHPVPLTREAHSRGVLEVIQKIKQARPDILIEAHDTIVGGRASCFLPRYFMHGLPNSFDEGWAFEFMHNPLADLIEGRALSLYYYNLAYDLPLYLHIPMYADNENLLMFWWYASTVRHLGIGGLRTSYAWPGRGGFHPLPEERFLAYKAAVAEYQSLKRFFARGQFFGIDEYTHVHTISDENAAVINLFNVTQEEVRKVVEVDISQVGLKSVESVDGAEGRKTDAGFLFEIQIPPMSPKLVNINV